MMRSGVQFWVGLIGLLVFGFVRGQGQIMPTTAFPDRPCRGRWVHIPQERACFWYSHIKADWISASAWCNMLGGYLMDGSGKSYHAMKNMPTDRRGNYWIGLSDIDGGMARWMHSKEVILPRLLMGPPPDDIQGPPGPMESCYHLTPSGGWRNENCGNKNWFICDRKMV